LPGRHITNHHEALHEVPSDTPPVAAAKASFSTSTAYRFEKDRRLPSQKKGARDRRRPDPLADMFATEVVPMFKAAPGLRPIAIFEETLRRHPELGAGIRRTLERRIRFWRAIHGKEQEVIFRQTTKWVRSACPTSPTWANWASPSRACRSIIASTTSGWPIPDLSTPMSLGGESFVALAEGLQNALWSLGGAPQDHRTDSLSAAFCNLERNAQDDLTRQYEVLCAHYGMRPTRNNRGIAHENGSIESSHGHLKRTIIDALLLRGPADFDDLATYRGFIDEIVSRRKPATPSGSTASAPPCRRCRICAPRTTRK
jgi:hypothetical protein